MNEVQFEPKGQDEQKNLVFDFISKMANGETISIATVTATVYTGIDASPSSIISGLTSSSGTKVTQLIVAGLVGVIYQLVCTITTSTGQVLTLVGLLAITSGVV